ncbi:hypothetical protein R1flu_014506 [Riccia fluitans]|uniref:Uncharacterized protein n=1 Tax=Riccia fluitans TaxID=41844 RepID=A0ABD1YGN1_9MARC
MENIIQALLDDINVMFNAIAGQHSAAAQRAIQSSTELNPEVKKRTAIRKARILTGGFSTALYHELSAEVHKVEQENIFIPSFPQLLQQARSEWMHMKRPTSSKGV